MTWRVPELLVTILLAFGFCCIGDMALRRVSRRLIEWNESFLVGIAVCAAALVFASMMLPHGALPAITVCLVVAVSVRVVRLNQSRGARSAIGSGAACVGSAGGGILFGLLLLLIVLLVAVFGVLNLRVSYVWDGFQIWASKALVLYNERSLTHRLFITTDLPGRFTSYPAAVPMYEGLLSFARGDFDFNSLKPVFFVFYCSLIVSTYHAAAALVPPTPALAVALVTGALPMLCTGPSVGGYADMPLACYVAAASASFLRREGSVSDGGRPLPWLAGGMAMVKDEGSLLLAASCFAGSAVLMRGGLHRLPRVFRKNYSAIAIGAAFVGVQILYRWWVNVPDLTYGPVNLENSRRAIARLGEVARGCGLEMITFRTWGILWLALPAAAAIASWRGSVRAKQLTASVLLALVCYASLYLYTNWDPSQHISNSFPRLLSHLAPPSAVLVAYAFFLCLRETGPRVTRRAA